MSWPFSIKELLDNPAMTISGEPAVLIPVRQLRQHLKTITDAAAAKLDASRNQCGCRAGEPGGAGFCESFGCSTLRELADEIRSIRADE